jgi:hypothetical protein
LPGTRRSQGACSKVSISSDVPSGPIEHIGPLFIDAGRDDHDGPSNPDSEVFPAGRKGITRDQAIKAVTILPAWQNRLVQRCAG